MNRTPVIVALAAALVLGGVPVPAHAAPARKVLVLGVDGLDPKLLQEFMDAGDLPSFRKLVETGDFKPLQTTMPPLSPVAWSTFITGTDPGGHGIFDFIHRDPESLIPYLSMASAEGPKRTVPVGLPLGDCDRWILPLDGGKVENLRKGVPFWHLLADADVPTTIYRMPANFPPEKSAHRALSGMGTPDITGTSGTFSYYTNRPVANPADVSGGEVHLVSVVDNVVEARIYGPENTFCQVKKRSAARRTRTGERQIVYDNPDMTIPFQVYIDADEPVARIVIGETEVILREGEWSDWVRVDFTAIPLLASVGAIGKFYMQEIRPDFKLYLTPLQITPEDPALPITQPASWAGELYEALGPFYTQELPEDTKAYQSHIFTGREFWQQSQFVYAESRRAFDYALENWNEGLLFFYFSSVDQGSHMLWHFADGDHPGFQEDDQLMDGIRTLYRELDEVVGRAMSSIDDDTTLIVMSDHGFCPFYWQINLNTWLMEQGYVVLRDPSRQGQIPFFGNVDWAKTRAYALGLNSLYINLAGREKRGIVKPEERQALMDKLEADLLAMRDPQNGREVVTLVIQTDRDFHGPHKSEGPDMIVGYNWGYRTSWKSPLGEFPLGVYHDNLEPWSGDHSVDYRHVPGVLLTNRTITLDSPALYDLTVGILDEFGVPKNDAMIGSDCLGPRP